MSLSQAIDEAVAALEPGGRLVRSTELVGGVSADVHLVELTTAMGDQRSVVFRRHRASTFKDRERDIAAMEFAVLESLRSAGLPVPEPILLSEPSSDAPRWQLIEWIDGSIDVEADDLSSALDQMASFLVDLHALDPSEIAVGHLEEIEDPAPGVLPYLPETGLGELVRNKLTTEPATPRDDAPANASVVIHGDYWPGNVMWHEGRLAAVIDWEDTRTGDPLADLACARAELLCSYGSKAADFFFDRYLEKSRRELRLDRLPIWDVYVSASALKAMHEWGLPAEEEAARRSQTEQFFTQAATQLLQRQGV